MRISEYRSSVSVAALGLGLMFASGAYGQDAAKAAKPATAVATAQSDTAGLDTIVVTASGGDKTKLKSSISVSSVSNDAITNFTPRSEAEVLRSIPGLNLQDTAGAGGNANIGVRGIPVSTGGSEYVALQEDGLPVTLFGDIQFGNNDYWIRFDNNVERVEAVRGGSASTFSSQAPGAVVNYISRTGDKEGGSIALNKGVNFRETRLDFDYGTHVTDTLRFHIGGFFKDGNGPNHIGYTASRGYQIKGNITKDFADNKGYIRLNFKRLDDREPTNTSQPSLATISGGNITGFSTFGNVDARKYSSAGIYNQSFLILNEQGNLQRVLNEGIHPKTTSFGGEFHYEFTDAFSVTDKFRWANQSGVFANQWTGENQTVASSVSCSVHSDGPSNGNPIACPTVTDVKNVNYSYNAPITNPALAGPGTGNATARYAAGPKLGQIYTDPYINGNDGSSAQAYVNIKDLGSLANDVTVNGKANLGDSAKLNVKAGWFHFRQTIALDWRINHTISSLNSSSDSVPLDFFDAAGNQLTANGQTGFNNQWGNCCGGRTYDLDYIDDAPYLNLDAKIAGLDLEASVRWDSVKASGQSFNKVVIGQNGKVGTVAPGTVTVQDALGSAVLPTLNTTAVTVDTLNYTKSYVSWSFGALYSVNNDTSVFARVSRGGRFNADRLLYGGFFNADGTLNGGGQNNSVNFVSQQEVGVKNRGQVSGGSYNFEATLFRAGVTEHNYDFSAPSRGLSPIVNSKFKSYGVEADGSVRFGGFFIDGSLVYTHARINGGGNNGKTPHTAPTLTYRFSPSYDMEYGAIGFTVDGQTSAYAGDDNALKIPGATLINAFFKARPYGGFELGMNVNNLFNTLAYRGSGGLSGGNLFDNSAVTGRTISASVRYKF